MDVGEVWPGSLSNDVWGSPRWFRVGAANLPQTTNDFRKRTAASPLEALEHARLGITVKLCKHTSDPRAARDPRPALEALDGARPGTMRNAPPEALRIIYARS